MKIKALAKQLTVKLENMGWDINEIGYRHCNECDNTTYGYNAIFCNLCGNKLKDSHNQKGTQDLEDALTECLKGFKIEKVKYKLK